MMNWHHCGFNVFYGFYSNKSRGLRKILVRDLDRGAGTDDAVPALIESLKKIQSQPYR